MPKVKILNSDKKLRAYIVGAALGDGNLSNPNHRAVRLRISCDKKYPKLLKYLNKSLQSLFPDNRVNTINKHGCVDVSVYSNFLPQLLGWRWDSGPKHKQNVSVPFWIKQKPIYTKECLRGLLQTDGSIYKDRGYLMVNFVNHSKNLADDVTSMMASLGYKPNVQALKTKLGTKYTVRISKDTKKFIREVGLWKS